MKTQSSLILRKSIAKVEMRLHSPPFRETILSTMTFVNDFLKPLIPESKFTILPLAGDASSRRYSRIVANSKTWVLMEWEPFTDIDEFPFLSVLSYFEKANIPVPKVLGLDSTKGFFLLEDLGDLTLERKFWEFQNQENILPYYQLTLDELIKIHSLSFEKANHQDCTAYHVEFSTEKLMWEFRYMKTHLLQRLLNLPESYIAPLENHFLEICTSLHALPQVICHRDFHSRNVMIQRGKVSIIDFQDARLGPAVYDLVSLFHDSYVRLNENSIETLMKYYLDNFKYSDELLKDSIPWQRQFDLQSIQRCLKACGSFASFFNDRDDERYLKYINPTLKLVLRKLENFPEYSDIKNCVQLALEKRMEMQK